MKYETNTILPQPFIFDGTELKMDTVNIGGIKYKKVETPTCNCRKDIYVITAPGSVSTEVSDAIVNKLKDKLGDEDIVVFLSDGMSLEVMPGGRH